MPRVIDLTGQKFNRWTVLRRDLENVGHGARWICECECGTIRSVQSGHLRSGASKSCGCFNLEQISERTLVNLAGEMFGKLTVIERDMTVDCGKGNVAEWICKCECGNLKTVKQTLLRNGHVQSCGCISYSIGEENIAKLLTENKILFQREYKFEELGQLRYDFALFDENWKVRKLIEFDGRQHSDKNSVYYSEDGVRRDKEKDEFAKSKGIELVRVDYKDRDRINLELIKEA